MARKAIANCQAELRGGVGWLQPSGRAGSGLSECCSPETLPSAGGDVVALLSHIRMGSSSQLVLAGEPAPLRDSLRFQKKLFSWI